MPTTSNHLADPPPVGWFGYVWRYAVAVLISAAAWSEVVADQWTDHRALFWLDIAIGLFCFAIVPLRRRFPLPIALVIGVLSAVSGIAAGPSFWAAVSLATRRVLWQIVLVGVVLVAAGNVYVSIQPAEPQVVFLVGLSVNALISGAILGWGMYIGSRRELLATLRDQVRRAREEQELRAREARSGERARIAREMHDVLAHRISQVSMLANAVSFREDLTADEMRESVRTIQQTANEALIDLRSVLGVLRDPESGELLHRPQPTYADLPQLVAEATATGMQVEYDDAVDPGLEVPVRAGRTAYRIVQEALTNARKHAPGATVTVRLSGNERDGFELLVRNPLGFRTGETAGVVPGGVPGGVPGAGMGLVGLRERAELAGGRLEHGVEGSSFVLRAWIPFDA